MTRDKNQLALAAIFLVLAIMTTPREWYPEVLILLLLSGLVRYYTREEKAKEG